MPRLRSEDVRQPRTRWLVSSSCRLMLAPDAASDEDTLVYKYYPGKHIRRSPALVAPAIYPLQHGGNAINLDVEVPRPRGHVDKNPCRRVFWKESRVHGIDDRKVLNRCTVDIALEDVIQ
jgi:hypothetical protein